MRALKGNIYKLISVGSIHKKVLTQGLKISKLMYHWVQDCSQAAGTHFVVHLWIALEDCQVGSNILLNLTKVEAISFLMTGPRPPFS